MIKKDLQCPCCGLPWAVFSEQAACVALFGECIACRFSPSGKGSRAGNTDELERIIAKAKDARAKPAPTMKMLHLYSDLAGDGGMDPRNNFDAQPEQEPVAWRTFDGEGGHDYRSYEMNENYANEWAERNPRHKGWVEPLYTTPPQREWAGLTDEEIEDAWAGVSDPSRDEIDMNDFARAIEAKLKEKNT